MGIGPFEFAAPRQIVFGWGRRAELTALAAPFARRVFLVTGSRTLEETGRVDDLLTGLRAGGIEPVHLGSVAGEPTVRDVDLAAADLLSHQPAAGDAMLALGGGSAIDLAKAVAAMATSPDRVSVKEFLEGVGSGRTIDWEPLPIIALPTTGGTGAEATRNAVISSQFPSFKKSLRSPRLVPRLVVVDPELAASAPPHVTAWTGMDAITQLLESYVSRRATPITRALCETGMTGALTALRAAVDDGESRPAREKMAQAALLSGMALANSGLGMAHGVAAALGVHGQISHGLACAVMLPVAIEANREQCRADLARAARLLTGSEATDDDAAIDGLLGELEGFYSEAEIPCWLSSLNISIELLGDLVRDSRGSSMSGNPRDLSDDELAQLLEANW
ncbi:MAG: iron-containing alcohol dehydrogenase [Pirellulales bacterium]|nr:iron-containing alcohol dehydrogenase [Pirellulales bacterium]